MPAKITSVPTMSQPQIMTGGPPCRRPYWYRVKHPDRIEMIVKEIAKLENLLMLRLSSWAYPISWSLLVSSSI